VTASIVGIRTPEQAQRNAAAGDWDLSPKDLEEIEEIQGDLRLHYYFGPDKNYHGHRDKGDPGPGDGDGR
jgi:diketogulonate reductase-like aldo/keto reductase